MSVAAMDNTVQCNTERDTLWCRAIIETQADINGRLVCDVETLLHYFNAHKHTIKTES